jgi:hypothetical protein
VTVSFTPTAANYFNQKLALRIVDNPNRFLVRFRQPDGAEIQQDCSYAFLVVWSIFFSPHILGIITPTD